MKTNVVDPDPVESTSFIFLPVGWHKNQCCGSGSGRIDIILPAGPVPDLYQFQPNVKDVKVKLYFFPEILICCTNYSKL
jgi:hypothetical protein